MKRALALILTFLLFAGSFAVADDKAQFPATLNFLQVVYAHGLLSTDSCADAEGDEEVQIALSDPDLGDVTFHIYFTPNNVMMIRVYDVVNFSCTFENAARVCNDLNGMYLFVKFYADPTTNTVSIAADMTLEQDSNCGTACFDLLANVVAATQDAAPTLITLK